MQKKNLENIARSNLLSDQEKEELQLELKARSSIADK